jgi:hypothetical protein
MFVSIRLFVDMLPDGAGLRRSCSTSGSGQSGGSATCREGDRHGLARSCISRRFMIRGLAGSGRGVQGPAWPRRPPSRPAHALPGGLQDRQDRHQDRLRGHRSHSRAGHTRRARELDPRSPEGRALHHVRYVPFTEDAPQLRTGVTPRAHCHAPPPSASSASPEHQQRRRHATQRPRHQQAAGLHSRRNGRHITAPTPTAEPAAKLTRRILA